MTKASSPLHFLTPPTEDGPLYPSVDIPVRSDLTRGGQAIGHQLLLMGVVFDFKRNPVSDTRVEIWQADCNGYYDHPRARGADALDDYWKISPNDLDPNFAYFGATHTDVNGIYWFRTIFPRWYHVFGTDRAAHIHLKMKNIENGVLTTELYFPGADEDAHRVNDRVYSSRRQQADLIVELQESSADRLSDVPLMTAVRYCRKDLMFL